MSEDYKIIGVFGPDHEEWSEGRHEIGSASDRESAIIECERLNRTFGSDQAVFKVVKS